MPTEMIFLAHVFDVTNNFIDRTEDVLQAITLAAAIGVVVWAYVKTRAMVPVIVAISTAAFALWMVHNIADLECSTEITLRALDDGGECPDSEGGGGGGAPAGGGGTMLIN